MKNMKRIVVLLIAILMINGCGCNKECNCPVEENVNEEYKNIIYDYSEKYKETVRSVVMIKIQDKENDRAARTTGSGVVFFEENENAYILTNAHVIKDFNTTTQEIEVFFSTNEGVQSGKSEIASVMGKDFNEDVAVLRIEKSEKYIVAQIGDSSQVEVGDYVYTIGSPLGVFNLSTSGNISKINKKISPFDPSNTGNNRNVYGIVSTAPINSGNSGGALFNSDGKVIGITTLKYEDAEGFYVSLPINYFMKVAKYVMVNEGSYPRPTVNLQLKAINELGTLRETYQIGNTVEKGVYVASSSESNIENGIVITKVNDITIYSENDFWVEILKCDAGNAVALTVINKNGLNERTITVTLHI